MSTPPSTPAPTEQKQKAPRNKYAQASVVFGIVSMLLAFIARSAGGLVVEFLGLVAGLAAVGTGVLGYRAAQELMKGRNWAITGIIIGGIGILTSLVLFIAP